MNYKIDPSYLRYIHDGLDNKNIHSENASSLPDGLSGSYEDSFLGALNVNESQKLLNRFAVLSILKNEVSANFIAEILQETENEILEFVSIYSKYFNSSQSGKYEIYHERFRIFILEKISQNEFLTINQKIIGLGQDVIKQRNNSESEKYALEYLSSHLLDSAMISGDGMALTFLSFNSNYLNRQVEISKGFKWSKQMLQETIHWASKYNKKIVLDCGLQLLDLYKLEQNESQYILDSIKKNEFDFALERLNTFGDNVGDGARRRFLLTVLIINTILNENIANNVKATQIRQLLQFIDTEITSDLSRFDWARFCHSNIILETGAEIDNIDLDSMSLYNKSKNISFEHLDRSFFNKENLRLLIKIANDCHEKSERCKMYVDLLNGLLKYDNQNQDLWVVYDSILNELEGIAESIGFSLLLNKIVEISLQLNKFSRLIELKIWNQPSIREKFIEARSRIDFKNDLPIFEEWKSIVLISEKPNSVIVFETLKKYISSENYKEEYDSIKSKVFNSIKFSERCFLIIQLHVIIKSNRNELYDDFFLRKFLQEFSDLSSINNLYYSIHDFLEKPLSVFKGAIKTLLEYNLDKEINELLEFGKVFSENCELELFVIEQLIYSRNNKIDVTKFPYFNNYKNQKNIDLDTSKLVVSLLDFISENIKGAISIFNNLAVIENKNKASELFLYLCSTTKYKKYKESVFLGLITQNGLIPTTTISELKAYEMANHMLIKAKKSLKGKFSLVELQQQAKSILTEMSFCVKYEKGKEDYLFEIAKTLVARGDINNGENLLHYIFDPKNKAHLFYEISIKLIEANNGFDFKKMLLRFDSEINRDSYLKEIYLVYLKNGNIETARECLSMINLNKFKAETIIYWIEYQKQKSIIGATSYDFNEAIKCYKLLKDKNDKISFLKRGANLIIENLDINFIIEELKILKKLYDRFLVYIEISKKLNKDEDIKYGRIILKRVENNLYKIEDAENRFYILCTLVSAFYLLRLDKNSTDCYNKATAMLEEKGEEKERSRLAVRLVVELLKIKKMVLALNTMNLITQKNDLTRVYNFIGSYFKINIKDVFSSSLKSFIINNDVLLNILSARVSKNNLSGFSDDSVYQGIILLNKNKDALTSLLVSYFLRRLFITEESIENQNHFINTLELQWALDLKNTFNQN